MSPEIRQSGTRAYRKRRRAEDEERTRLRITEATVKLHQEVGPRRATVSAIAAEAGVQRATVYRHFPDQLSLFQACTAHYYGQHPNPDFTAWAEISDPAKRLGHALGEMYAWFAETEEMLSSVMREPDITPAPIREGFLDYVEAVIDAVMTGRPERGAARKRARAAVAHATSYFTWESLCRDGGLSNADAVRLMIGMVESAA